MLVEGNGFTMPAKTTCPNCQLSIRVPVDYAGRSIKCPQCNQRFPVPGERPTPPPAATPAPTFDDLVLKSLDDDEPVVATPVETARARVLSGAAQYWCCPHCKTLGEKAALSSAETTVVCTGCGQAFGYFDVFGGKFDAVEVELACQKCGTLFTGPADILLGQPCPTCQAKLPSV